MIELTVSKNAWGRWTSWVSVTIVSPVVGRTIVDGECPFDRSPKDDHGGRVPEARCGSFDDPTPR
ncbi:hypothetical protein ACFQFH_04605 [Halobaculum halobium]|uniref:hypothetical protein n=1 Tax=Halobaculum halobium TaxID=3032281 RepID=UPI0036196F16